MRLAIAHADENADAFENHDPTDADFEAPLPPLMAVMLAAFRRAAAEKELAQAVHAARVALLGNWDPRVRGALVYNDVFSAYDAVGLRGADLERVRSVLGR